MSGAMAASLLGKSSRAYSLGNHLMAEETVLRIKMLLTTIFEAEEAGVLSAEQAAACRAWLFEFQTLVLTAVQPLLSALNMLDASAQDLKATRGPTELDEPTLMIRDLQARFRDTLVHGLFAHNLGFDSKKQFTTLVGGLDGRPADAELRIMTAYQEWFQVMDLKTGIRRGRAEASSSPRKVQVDDASSSAGASSSTAMASSSTVGPLEGLGGPVCSMTSSKMEPMEVPIPEWAAAKGLSRGRNV